MISKRSIVAIIIFVIVVIVVVIVLVVLKLKYSSVSSSRNFFDKHNALNLLMKYWTEGKVTEKLSNGNGTPSTCNTLLGPEYQNAVKEGSCPANVYKLHVDQNNLTNSNNGGEFDTSENKQQKSFWGFGKTLDWKLNSGKADGVVNIQENNTGKVSIGTDKVSSIHRTNLVGGLEADKLTVRGPIHFTSADGNLTSLTDMNQKLSSDISGLESNVNDLMNATERSGYEKNAYESYVNIAKEKMKDVDSKLKKTSNSLNKYSNAMKDYQTKTDNAITSLDDHLRTTKGDLTTYINDKINHVDKTMNDHKLTTSDQIRGFKDSLQETTRDLTQYVDTKVNTLSTSSSSTQNTESELNKGVDIRRDVEGKIHFKNNETGDGNSPYSIEKLDFKKHNISELRLTLNDSQHEALAIYSKSCKDPKKKCSGPAEYQHYFKANGTSLHRNAICISVGYDTVCLGLPEFKKLRTMIRDFDENDKKLRTMIRDFDENENDRKKLKGIAHQAGYAVNGEKTTHLLFEGYHKLYGGANFDAWSNDKWDVLYVNKGWKLTVWNDPNKRGFKQEFENTTSFTPLKMDLKQKNRVSEYEATWIGYPGD